jgi:LmbE family N-acetylglucosaminyl deacetylase
MGTSTVSAASLQDVLERRTIESKVMIVAAHPDDETIGMGAQLCRFRNALLVQVTDGAPRDRSDANAHGYSSTPEYAAARRSELAAALETGRARGVRTRSLVFPIGRPASIGRANRMLLGVVADWNSWRNLRRCLRRRTSGS